LSPTEVLLPFTKSTTRALAASVALVAAGATVAAAAVFQLPILGFGRASVASAIAVPDRVKPPVEVVRRKVKPKVVVKTRYVDDIVHRPAPVRTYNVNGSPGPAQPPATIAFVSTPTPTPTVTVPTAITRPAAAPTPSTTAAWNEDDTAAHEHDGPSVTEHSTHGATAPTPTVDQ
jgi:hypothetical protein